MAVAALQVLTKFRTVPVFQGIHNLFLNQKQSLSTDHVPGSNTEETSLSNEDSSSNKHSEEDHMKIRILSAALPFVLQHGWTRNAISAGAESICLPGVMHGMFPRGGIELLQYFYVISNEQLANTLRKEADETLVDPSKKKESSVFVREAVEARLRMVTPYISKWPQALGLMTLPPNVPTSLANLLTLVDDICYYAGDRSVNFSWYTHRVTLAGIYKTTELCLIQDKSEDFYETWRFLERRIQEAAQLRHYLHQSEEATQVAKEAITASFITARNILGLNLGDR